MAGMTPRIPLATHFRAVAYLRGRLFANNFRRKGGAGELIGQIIGYPFLALVAFFPIAGAGFGAFAAVHYGKPETLGLIYWAIFALWLVVSINLAPPGLAFDPESLIRFPVSFARYLVIRLFLGLLSASTVVGSLALLAAAIGIGVANTALLVPALVGGFALALSNMLMTRMVFAWVDRWLSTRRAREIFTGLIFVFAIGMQYLNVTFNGLGKHTTHAQQAAKIAAVKHFFHAIQPVAAWLPPGLAAQTVLRPLHQQPLIAVLAVIGLLLYATLFLAVFAWRTLQEFRGESLSDTITPAVQKPVERTVRASAPAASGSPIGWSDFGLPGPIAAVLEKEFLYIRRNTAMFYGLAAPVIMVVIFAGRLGAVGKTGLAFPLGIGYSLLGLAAFAYNSFGLDQAGIQFYFLAPVRFRSIVLAKNLLMFGIVIAQVALVYGVVVYATGTPPLLVTAITVLWVVFAIFTNTLLGNYRSLSAPKKIYPGKLARKQASQLSALMSVGLMMASFAIVGGLYVLGKIFDRAWLPVPVLVVLGVAAVWGYLRVLDHADNIALSHRETLIEELCKAS